MKRVEEHVGTPGPMQDDGEAITFHSIYEQETRLISARGCCVVSRRPSIHWYSPNVVWDERNPMAEPRRVLKPESIRRECDASLPRLGALPLP